MTPKKKSFKMSKVIGYTLANDGSYVSLHEPDKGRIVTQAFILCSDCNKFVYHCMGPNHRAICLECFKAKKQVAQNV